MRIRFVREEGKADRVYVTRDDGSESSWSFPSYGVEIPHDLVHLIVEDQFAIRDGFWGRVAGGADVARINAIANRTGGANKYVAFGDDLTGLYLAEALAGASWAVAMTGEERRALVAAQHADLPERVTAAALEETMRRIEAARREWRALGVKGTLERTW